MGKPEFPDYHLGVYCCGHLFRRERQVLLVAREGDDWQFLCGGTDHNDPLEPYHVSVGFLINTDASLHEVADLPPDWEAERTHAAGSWMKTNGIQ